MTNILALFRKKKPDQPEVLYKYIPPDKFNYYFPKLYIAFPKLELLNDPMESTIEDMIKKLRDVRPEPYTYSEVNRVWSQGVAERPYNPLALKELNARMDAIRANNHILTAKTRLMGDCRQRLGILSLTNNPLNPVMWSHYADTYKGICIGFRTKDLTDIYTKEQELFLPYQAIFNLHKVKYKKKSPKGMKLSIENYVISAFATKSSKWSYEEEYRLLRPLANEKESIRVQQMPIEIVSEVYIGERSPYLDHSGLFPKSISLFKVSQKIGEYQLQAVKM
jgi:hypothetical protein